MTQALGLKVLVADDTAANRNMMEAFLRKLGFSCVTARDGREALQVFEQAQPDLVLMDLMMPEMDGFEATRLIRQQQGARWVPVVILSALSTEEDIIAGLDCGADDYLTKPISFAVFSAKMRTMIRLLSMQRSVADALERVSSISNAVIDGVMSIDEHGIIQSSNRAACAMFGYDADELIGQSVGILRADGDGACVSRMIAQYLDGAEARFIGHMSELDARKRNGETFVVEIGMNEMRLADSRLFIAVTRDVTERHRIARQLADTAERLQRFYDEQTIEQDLARSIMERQVQREWLRDPRVGFAVMPATHFSGDLVLVARSDQNRTYAMLADATGHGLAAAVSVLPALSLFYRLATRDVPLADLIRELNDQLRAALPVGRFVGAALVCLEKDGLNGEVWVGGVPGVLLLAEDGSISRRFASQQLPLGIVPSSPLASLPVSFEARPGQQIVVYSDGLTEATNAAGEMFGEQRLLAALAGSDAGGRLEAGKRALAAHLAGVPSQDDVSLLLLACEPSP
ncbi:MAG: SpoIIE family protein phosphatase [Rhodocyclaceae bacterium]|nr:SpoIIE family protein phosphatase [Rhodocyclaceae bacterium]